MTSEERLTKVIRSIYETMPEYLNERQQRLLSGCIAEGYGYGGIKIVCKISGMDFRTVKAGIKEINGEASPVPEGRIRREGAGRPSYLQKYPTLDEKVEEILNTNTYGDPERVLTWTNLSLRDISKELLARYEMEVGKDGVSDSMERLGYSRQVNQKMEQVGAQHPDRDAQFEFINKKAHDFIQSGVPVISCDTKKKELIGNFKNNGSEYRKQKDPRRVLDHDFPLEGGKVAPYGVYVINNNTAYVNLGTDHDTSAFAVESIRRWWRVVGHPTFPDAKKIFINCDGGGSNGWRVRLWKYELALLAEETGLEIHVSHFPPGTSKWNKIEHRLFCFITQNWAGKPLIDIQTTVNLIQSTTTEKGLTVRCEVDNGVYATGIKLDDDDFNKIDIEFVGPNLSWNYIIKGFK